jgi:hypothetical protein
MVFNGTFNIISVISWLAVSLLEETGVPGENHWPVASNWQSKKEHYQHVSIKTRNIDSIQFI